MAQIREELSFSISQPIKHPDRFEALGLASAAGVLLFGPPGATCVCRVLFGPPGATCVCRVGSYVSNGPAAGLCERRM